MKTQVLIIVLVGLFGAGSCGTSVSVTKGDSVTLTTDVKIIQEQDVKWYFNDIPIAHIIADASFTCTDVQCNEDNEGFRDRLKLDHQTGSLTIMDTKNTDSGVYTLQIIRSGENMKKSFIVSVCVSAVPLAEVRGISVEEGDSISLDSGVARQPNDDLMTWHFNDILIAEVTEGQSKVCVDDQCKKLFKDRLKLDNHTGSLTITNIRIKQAGLYNLHMLSSGSNICRHHLENSKPIVKSFHVDVTKSGLSPAFIAIIFVAVALLISAIAAGGIYCRNNQRK